ncbi:hypothetical protein ABT093_19985 [Kitasatospora sp. NPDC002551]|uniref:hypothetical protein n=1 Tax=Kitasatospora sp. NPDC002551 TaxID=3154539 RepID=UPI00331905EF
MRALPNRAYQALAATDPVVQAFLTHIRYNTARLRTEREKGGLSIEAAILIGALVLAAIGLGTFIASKLSEKQGQIK